MRVGEIRLVEDELERLKRRKFLEIKRRLEDEQERASAEKPEKKEEPEPKEVLDRFFFGRAWEIYNTAWNQFPKIMPQIEKALVEAMSSGRIQVRIDGEALFHFLRRIGLPIRLKTTIKFKEHGELKTLEQKIRENK
jgi:programmed cell death protein 5